MGRGLRTTPRTRRLRDARRAGARVVPIVFVVGGLFTALGAFYSRLTTSRRALHGREYALKAFRRWWSAAWANIWGAILAAFLIGVVETFSITWFGARAVDIGAMAFCWPSCSCARPASSAARCASSECKMSGYVESVLVLLAIKTTCSRMAPSCRWCGGSQPRRRRLRRHRRL